jgi:ABC-2 type transport system permease protein
MLPGFRAIFKHTLERSWMQIMWWGFSLGALGLVTVAFYPSVATMRDSLQQMINSIPEGLLTFFGDAQASFAPAGYLGFYFFSYLPLIMGIFAVLEGSGMTATDEEKGTLDLVLAYPVSRMALLLGRAAAQVVIQAGILLVTWLCCLVLLGSSKLEIGWLALLLPFISLLAVSVLFTFLALCLSLVMPSRTAAASTTGLLLVVCYFLSSFQLLDKNLVFAAKFSPLSYYQSGNAVNGLNWGWFLGLLAAALIFAVLATWLFQRRDIRVGGVAGWRWLSLQKPNKTVAR